MNIEEVRKFCLSKIYVTEGFPFNETTLVFKVKNKMFALLTLDGNNRLNLKCDPEKALLLRDRFSYIIPGFHMNKKHWNSILIEQAGDLELKEWIDDSYNLIVASLSKKDRLEIENGI